MQGVVACGDGAGPGGATGTFELVLTGLHPSATSGGTVNITPQAGGAVIPFVIPATGPRTVSVPVGTYTVAYTPPANHQLAAGQTVPSTVTITEGATTTVSLTLVAVGSIAVTVTGLTGTPANGGSASAQRTDAAGTAIPISISAAGSGTATNVPTGTYTITYTPPAGFTSSGTNPATGIVVALGAAAPVTFTVVPPAATGTIRVAVTGITSGTSGGSVSAQLVGSASAPLTGNLPAPSGGASALDLTAAPTGNYNVTYTAPSGFRLVAGQANPQSVTVTAGATVTANFSAEVQPTAGGVLFNSDWSTALGTTVAARRDTGKTLPWDQDGGTGLEVISSAGLDFPSPNVLRVSVRTSNSGFAFLRRTGLPIPAVGESRFYRWYTRIPIGDNVAAQDPETHPHQDGNAAGQCNWLFHVYHDGLAGSGANQWTPQFRPAASANAFPNDRWTGPHLNKNTTYRFEHQILRNGANTFQMHIRVYNSAGTLLHTDSAFNNNNTPPNGTLASNPTFNFLTLANMDGLNAGLNGLAGSDWPDNTIYMYQGAMAVSSADWIGPYAGGV